MERLKETALLAIATHRSGRFIVIAKLAEQTDGSTKVLVQDSEVVWSTLTSRQGSQDAWTGQLVLSAKRASLGEIFRSYDNAWFVPVILSYRRILDGVLLTSFFLQLFALVPVLLFQVVIDKVPVHRNLTTLDILVIGLAIITLLEVLLGGLRASERHALVVTFPDVTMKTGSWKCASGRLVGPSR